MGERPHRFGYTPGNADEIKAATGRALSFQFSAEEPRPLSWDELAPRLVRPMDFADTAIAPHRFTALLGRKDATGRAHDFKQSAAGANPGDAEIKEGA